MSEVSIGCCEPYQCVKHGHGRRLVRKRLIVARKCVGRARLCRDLLIQEVEVTCQAEVVTCSLEEREVVSCVMVSDGLARV
jgi:hypothetical protein